MPMAVPSWEAVLMMPDAEPRQYVSTSVPRPVVATEDSPMPAPATAAQAATASGTAAEDQRKVGGSDAHETEGNHQLRAVSAQQGGGQAGPPITARLKGSNVAAASSGLRRSVFCRYRVTSVSTELVVAVLSRLPPRPGAAARSREAGVAAAARPRGDR